MYRNQAAPADKSLITERIKSVPIVASTVNQVTEVYTKTRDRNALLRLYFTAVEKSLSVATNIAMTSAKPIYKKFDQPIMILNNIACSQMDNVEKRYPIIMKPTDEVLKATMETCTVAMSPVIHFVEAAQSYKDGAVSSVKNFSSETVSSTTARCQSVAKQLNERLMANVIAKYALDKIDNTVGYIDDCADKYLPDKEGVDKTQKLNNEDYLVQKVIHVSRKLTRRLTRRCYDQGLRVKVNVGSACQQVSQLTLTAATSTYAVAKATTLTGLELAKTKGLHGLEFAKQAANGTMDVVPNIHYYLNSLDDYITNNFQAEVLSQKELSKAPSGAALKIFYLGNKAFFCVSNHCGTAIAQMTTRVTTQPLEIARKYVSNGRELANNVWKEINLSPEMCRTTPAEEMTMYSKSIATARHVKMIGYIWLNKLYKPLILVTSYIVPSAKTTDLNQKSNSSAKKETELQKIQPARSAQPGANLLVNNIADGVAQATEGQGVAGGRQKKEAELEVEESSTDEDAEDDVICDNSSYSDAYKCNAYSFEFSEECYRKDPYFVPEER